MSQNRNKLIILFIGNVSNAIVHEILEKAINNKENSDIFYSWWNDLQEQERLFAFFKD